MSRQVKNLGRGRKGGDDKGRLDERATKLSEDRETAHPEIYEDAIPCASQKGTFELSIR